MTHSLRYVPAAAGGVIIQLTPVDVAGHRLGVPATSASARSRSAAPR